MHALYAHDVDEYSITVLPRGLHRPKSGTASHCTYWHPFMTLWYWMMEVNRCVSFETSLLSRNRFASSRSKCNVVFKSHIPQNSSNNYWRVSLVQAGVLGTHRLNTLPVRPMLCVRPPDVSIARTNTCSKVMSLHTTAHSNTMSDCEASRWGHSWNSYCVILFSKSLEVEVSIFCLC